MSTEIAIRKQLQETIAGQDPADFKAHVQSRSWGYVNDQQNGSYSNQVSFDLTSLVSGDNFMGLSEGYALNPYSIKASASAALDSIFTSKAVCLKDSMYSNFIDSIQLFVNNKQLIDQTNMSNIPIQIMDKLAMSSDFVKSHGSAMGVFPDTTTSIALSSVATTAGDGVLNNAGFGTTYTNAVKNNTGVESRVLSFANVASISTYAKTLSPYFAGATTSAGNWNFVVCVPLRRISDLLAKYPLVKGSQIRLVINFNAGSAVFTATKSATPDLSLKSVSMTAGATFPAMLTSFAGIAADTNGPLDITLTAGVQTSATSLGYSALPQCRVYVPTYKVNPTYEQRLLDNRVQTIRYLDWYQQPQNNIGDGQAFSQQLTTALPNVKLLIGVPYLNTASGVYATATNVPQYQSPFDTAPATTYPGLMSAFQNFNVQVNAVNVLNQNANYTFDIWTQQVSKLGLNGGMVKELSSGLIDQRSWNHSPFIVVDLSDRSESAEDTYQSVTVQGTNNSGKTVNIQWFVGFEKVVKFDIITGDVEKVFG